MNTIQCTFIKYVSFNALGMIGMSCYILADTFFIAKGVGTLGLISLNLAIPIYSFIHGSGLLIGMGGATYFSLFKRKETFTQTIYYVVSLSILFVGIGVFLSTSLAHLLGANSSTLQNTAVYLKTILCFSPAFLLNNVVLCFVRNDNNPKLSMMAMLIGSFSNILLDYIFIYPLHIGMFGAALATGLAPIISLGILSIHFIKKKHSFFFKKVPCIPTQLFSITHHGIPSLIMEFSSGIVIIVFNFILLNISGDIAVAAYGVIANIALVVVAIFTGVAHGLQPLLSTSHTNNKKAEIRILMKWGVIVSLFIAIFIYSISFVFTQPIINIFNEEKNAQLTTIATSGMHIYFIAFLFMGINILLATYYSATDNPKKAFIISILRGFLIIIPCAFILSTMFSISGVWMAIPINEILVLLVAMKMSYTKKHPLSKKEDA